MARKNRAGSGSAGLHYKACAEIPLVSQQAVYFYDDSLHKCFPFLFEGCGVGENNFISETLCYDYCRPRDLNRCAGNASVVAWCNSTTNWSCPAGSSCSRGAFNFGFCCDDEEEEEWRKEFNPTCEENTVLMIEVHWKKDQMKPLIGKSCSHQLYLIACYKMEIDQYKKLKLTIPGRGDLGCPRVAQLFV
ncbi:Kunitz/Bovine pancreatic trypsin inhibitor domain protein [Ancylostoma caninum]|uniref:Kunitz/Bovine pancreatic trypsin inhibitor domain protein n=1 Tax=Ancylostoma caninum TaxID=29170 RepID=A0A368GW56_ANCCA|nr:Kunitz/Bovine pancreatic trypsin inhibitor domain protein [Ancylostoma caninum]